MRSSEKPSSQLGVTSAGGWIGDIDKTADESSSPEELYAKDKANMVTGNVKSSPEPNGMMSWHIISEDQVWLMVKAQWACVVLITWWLLEGRAEEKFLQVTNNTPNYCNDFSSLIFLMFPEVLC